MSSQMLEVRFSGEQADFLSLQVRGRAYRQRQAYWDGNWLLVTVMIQVGKFSGQVPGTIRAEELELFRQRLEGLQQSLKGVVTFETMEEWLHFRMEADRLGIIEIAGTLSDDVGYPYNSLKFTITTDQTALAATLRQLQRVVEVFPVVDKP